MSVPTDTVTFKAEHIEMAHGAGGKASRRLVEDLIVPLFDNAPLRTLGDAATVQANGTGITFTTDSFVVHPLQFPGGSIGELAVNGTLNDLSVGGAQPVALSAALIVEAGLSRATLQTEVEAMAQAADAAGVPIVTGDTKVVEHGKADGMYVNTTGIGLPFDDLRLGADHVQPGDQILLSGPVGDHGITILLARGDLDLSADLETDSRCIAPLIEALVEAVGPSIRWLRDPTRGGVASALNELARDVPCAAVVYEDDLPVRPPVRGACEILGLDPLYIANEGQFVAVVAPDAVDDALDALHSVPGGDGARCVGEIRETPARRFLTQNPYGSTRVVDLLTGDPLPRIC